MVSKENNNRRVTKPELMARIKELEKRLMFIEKYLMEKGLYDETLEYVEDAMVAYEELPFEVASIIREEISSFLGGVGSAADCAGKIQSRMSIWLAENH